MEISKELFCKVCRKRGISLEKTGGAWISKFFKDWKKATPLGFNCFVVSNMLRACAD